MKGASAACGVCTFVTHVSGVGHERILKYKINFEAEAEFKLHIDHPVGNLNPIRQSSPPLRWKGALNESPWSASMVFLNKDRH